MKIISVGYKQTEVGVIPADWKLDFLGQNASILRGGSPRPIEAFITSSPEGVNWIKIGDVSANAKYIKATSEKIIAAGVKHSRAVKAGDLLLSNSMSYGRPYILCIDGCIHDGWLTISNYEQEFEKEFLCYILGSEGVSKQYSELAAGTGVKNLNKQIVGKVLLPYPAAIEEQRAIATALSDVDALIEAKRALLEKKRAIKQGTMQELLTGKRRLPGFPVTPMKNTEIGDIPEDWEVRELGSLVDICSAKRVLQSQWKSDGIPFYRTREIIVLAEQGSVENELYISQELYKRNSCICPAPTDGDIMLTAVGTIGKTYLVREGDCFYYKDASVLCLRNQRKIVSGYLNLQLSYVTVQNQINGDSDGTTVKTITINKAKKYLIPVPSSTLEQERIHEVIQDQDNEIRSLQKELSKLSCIKQGMMQNLLTGRIRLV